MRVTPSFTLMRIKISLLLEFSLTCTEGNTECVSGHLCSKVASVGGQSCQSIKQKIIPGTEGVLSLTHTSLSLPSINANIKH